MDSIHICQLPINYINTKRPFINQKTESMQSIVYNRFFQQSFEKLAYQIYSRLYRVRLAEWVQLNLCCMNWTVNAISCLSQHWHTYALRVILLLSITNVRAVSLSQVMKIAEKKEALCDCRVRQNSS